MLLWNTFRRDERGFVMSAELILIATLCVLGLIAGLTCVRDAVSSELKDLASAIGSINQSYRYSGMHGCVTPRCGVSSWTAGSAFFDQEDGGQPIGFDCTVSPVPAPRPTVVAPPAPVPCPTIEPTPCPTIAPAPCETPVVTPCPTPCTGPVLPQTNCLPVPAPCGPTIAPVQPTCCDPIPNGAALVHPGGLGMYPGAVMSRRFDPSMGPGFYPAPIGPGAFAPPQPLVW